MYYRSHKAREKIFCIGLNKTGTTTIEQTLMDFGYQLGNQTKGELLIDQWLERDFKSIINFTKSAEVFQDIPFSLPYTYIFLEQYYPKAKFILSIRDTPDIWYNSLVNYHSKYWGDGKNPPSVQQLKVGASLYKGFAYKLIKSMFNTSDEDLYNKEKLLNFYISHNMQVIDYFAKKEDKLLTINVKEPKDYFKFCKFLGKTPTQKEFMKKIPQVDKIN